MASRDEILRFIVETSGDENVIKLAKAIAEVGKASGEAAPEADKLLDELERITRLGNNIQQFVKLKAELADTEAKFNAAQKSARALADELSRSAATSKEVNAAYAKSDKQLATLTEQYAAQTLALKKLEGGLQKAGIDTANLGAAAQKLRDEETGVTAKITEFAAASEKAGKATKDAADGTKKLATEAKSAGGVLGEITDHLGSIITVAAAVSLALKGIQFGTDAAKSAAGIEASLSRVAALAKDAHGQLTDLNEGLEAAARDVNVSSEQAAAGLVALTEQGRNADDAMKSLVPTLRLAKIAQIDVAQAAGLVAGALDQFGLGAEDSARVVDVLVAASKGSKDALDGLTNELTKIAPLARENGLSFEQTAAALGVLTTNGVAAKDAGGGLATILQGLRDPTSALRQSLLGLGVTTGDFNKAITALTSNTPASQKALQDLDGSALKVVLSLGKLGPDALKNFTLSLQTAKGEAESTAKLLDDNLSGAIQHFANSFDRLGSSLLKPVLTPLKDEIEKLATSLDEFAKSPAFAEIQTAIGTMAAEGTKAFDAFVRSIDWPGLIANARTTFTDIAASMRGLGDQLAVAGAAIDVTIAGIRVAFNGLQTAVFGIATAITGAFTIGAKGVALYLEALARIPLAGRLVKDAVTEANNAVGGLAAVTEEFAKRAKNNFDETAKAEADLEAASAKLSAASEKAAAGVGQVGTAAGETAPKVQELGNQLGFVPDYMKEAAQSSVGVAKEFNVVGDAAERMARQQAAAAEASVAHARELTAAAQRARDAAEALKNLALSGKTNSDEFVRLQKEVAAANAELDRLKGKAPETGAALGDMKALAKDLGITLTSELVTAAAQREASLDQLAAKLGQAGIASGDTKKAFEAWAASARAATADADAATKAETERAIAVKETALGISDQLKKTGETVRETGKEFQKAGDDGKAGFGKAGDAAGKAGDAAKDAGQKTEDAMKGATVTLTGVAGAINGIEAAFRSVSDAAAKSFSDSVFLDGLKFSAIQASDAYGGMADRITQAVQQTQTAIDNQRASLGNLVGSLQQFANTGVSSFGDGAAAAEQMSAQLDTLQQQLQDGTTEFTLLGSQDLSQLQAALDGARGRLERLRQEAKAAEESLANLGSTLQDQIDQLTGNQADIENRRFEEQLKQIDELAKASGAAGEEEAAKARARASELHELKLRQIAEEQAARKKSNGGDSDPEPTGGGSGGGGGGRGGGGGSSGASGGFNVHVSGSVIGSNPQELAEALARIIKPQLDAIQRRSL